MHLAVGAAIVCVLAGGVLIYALSGLDESPRWWAGADAIRAGDAEVIDRAERLENAITTQLTAVRDAGDPRWAAAITSEQANAWLAVRLRETLVTHLGEHNLPEGIERVRVGIDGEGLIIGARVRHSSGSSVVWSRAWFELDEDGRLWVELSSLRVGTTPVPGWVLRAMESDRLGRSRYLLGGGALELGDGRTARLVALRVHDGRLEVVMETASGG